jgi:hypothetical protein
MRGRRIGFGETSMAAREGYREQVRVVAEARWHEKGVRSLPWWECVPNDEQLLELEPSGAAVDFKGNVIETRSEGRFELKDIAGAVCKATETTIETLRGRSRSIEVAAARKVFAVLAVEYLDHRVADVAAFVQKHPGSVSRWLETPPITDRNPESVKRTLELVAADLRVVRL